MNQRANFILEEFRFWKCILGIKLKSLQQEGNLLCLVEERRYCALNNNFKGILLLVK